MRLKRWQLGDFWCSKWGYSYNDMIFQLLSVGQITISKSLFRCYNKP